MNSKQATKALNEIVSYQDQFDPQDWRDYLYAEAVSFQVKTKSKKPVELLPEIWGLIKEFLLPSAKEVEARKAKKEVVKRLRWVVEVFDPLTIELLKFGKPCIKRFEKTLKSDSVFKNYREGKPHPHGPRTAIWGFPNDAKKLIEEENLTEYFNVVEGEEFRDNGRDRMTTIQINLPKHTYLGRETRF